MLATAEKYQILAMAVYEWQYYRILHSLSILRLNLLAVQIYRPEEKKIIQIMEMNEIIVQYLKLQIY